MHTIETNEKGRILINGQPYLYSDVIVRYIGTDKVEMREKFTTKVIILPALYSDIMIDGIPCASMSALQEYIDTHFFVEAPGAGGIIGFHVTPEDFGAKGDGITDDSYAIQRAIDFIISQAGGTVYVGVKKYLVNQTVYINKPIATPVVIKGDALVNKNSGNDRRGAVLAKYVDGPLLRINLKEDGTPYGTATQYGLNVAISGVSFESDGIANVNAIETYRTRMMIENVSAMRMRSLLYQMRPGPVGVTWNNYCDQSIYRNIRLYNMREYGLYLQSADSTRIENFYYEWPLAEAISGIYCEFSQALCIINALQSNGNHQITDKPNSAFIHLKECTGFDITGLHTESCEFSTVFYLDRCDSGRISGIHERFASKDMFRLSNCRSLQLCNLKSWTNPKAEGYYDINDVGSNSFDILFWGWRQVDFTNQGIVKQPVTNRPFTDRFGEVKSYQAAQTYVQNFVNTFYGDKRDTVYKPDGTADFTIPRSNSCTFLPVITADRVCTILPSADNPADHITIANFNNTTFKWNFGGSLLDTDGVTNINVMPNGIVYQAISDGSRWRIVTKTYLPATSSVAGTMVLTGEFGGTGLNPVITTILQSKIKKGNTIVAGTADFVATNKNHIYYLSGLATADHTFGLLASPADGDFLELINRNSTAFTWSFAVPVLGTGGTAVSTIPNGSYTYMMFLNGQWRISVQYITPIGTSAAIDFPSVSAMSESAAINITLTGVQVGENILLSAPNTPGIIYKSFVSAANTVSLIAVNFTTADIDPPNGTFKVTRI